MALTKRERRLRLKKRIAKSLSNSKRMYRLVVFRSNKEIYAQIVTGGKTLVFASSKSPELKGIKGNKSFIAREVGKRLADKAVSAGIREVYFDRNGYLYHGRVKSLAEGARENGLIF